MVSSNRKVQFILLHFFCIQNTQKRYVRLAQLSLNFTISHTLYVFFIKDATERLNPLTPNDHYSGRTAPLTSKRSILYIYSTNMVTEYFKRGIYSPFFSLQNAVCFIILTYLVLVLFTFYIQSVLKF